MAKTQPSIACRNARRRSFEKEAAIFVPTGSMGNQTAVKLHTRPGQEVVIEERGHIYNFEMATMSAFSGVLARPVKSNDGSGILTWDEIAPRFTRTLLTMSRRLV